MQYRFNKYNFIILALLAILTCTQAYCQPNSLSALSLPKVLPADSAFAFTLSHDDSTLNAEWQIAANCYLYQDRLKISVSSDLENVPLYLQNDSPAETIEDPSFGSQTIYRHSLKIPMTLTEHATSNFHFYLQIEYQGCAESGFCYPPMTKWFEVKVVQHKISEVLAQQGEVLAQQESAKKLPSVTLFPRAATDDDEDILEVPNLAQTQKQHHALTAIGTFYLLGILLTFTPCVLPMIPILFGVIVGQKHLNTRKAFWLSLSYVLSMALTYALAGIIVATLGKNLQAYLQQPAVIIAFAALFAYLGLTQLGIIRITLPHGFSVKELLTKIHAKQESGTYVGAAIMGMLATLISSPCITPPLIGALSYISQHGNILLGGSALLALGLGMGTVLLLIGTLGGKYFPKAGAWMHHVNQVVAIVMFGISLWLLDRIFHGPWILLLWAGLCLLIAWYLKTFHHRTGWSGRVGILFVLYAILLCWGAWLGEGDPLKPFAYHPWSETTKTRVSFQPIHSVADFTAIASTLEQQDTPWVLVFYADWCVSCKHLEDKVFSNPQLQGQLQNWKLVQADVTRHSEANRMLLQKFDLIGPPAILFFDKNGRELTNYRIIGEISYRDFIEQLDQIKKELHGK